MVECQHYKLEVTGSSPVRPTMTKEEEFKARLDLEYVVHLTRDELEACISGLMKTEYRLLPATPEFIDALIEKLESVKICSGGGTLVDALDSESGG